MNRFVRERDVDLIQLLISIFAFNSEVIWFAREKINIEVGSVTRQEIWMNLISDTEQGLKRDRWNNAKIYSFEIDRIGRSELNKRLSNLSGVDRKSLIGQSDDALVFLWKPTKFLVCTIRRRTSNENCEKLRHREIWMTQREKVPLNQINQISFRKPTFFNGSSQSVVQESE